MKSKRTISYIGLWALIMPWLGFSWGTKTFLFSLTGVVLLIIGNRQYHNEKKKERHSITKEATNDSVVTSTAESITNNDEFYNTEIKNLDSNIIKTEIAPNTTNENIVTTKPRVRRKIEMTPRVKKIAIKSEPYSIENSNYDIQ